MKPLCIAHRGKHDKYFENTKEAFLEAAKGEYYGIETDIHLTKDLKWITHHNDDIISNGKNYFIKDLTFDEIINMHLDNDQNHENATVCKFEDYLQICKESGKRPIIEFKGSPKAKYVKKLAKYIDQYMGISNVTFIGFYPLPLFHLKMKYGKKLDAAYLVQYHHELIRLAIFIHIGLDIEINELTEKIVRKFHKRNRKINVWTVDTNEGLEKAINLGVDLVTTNVFNQKS